MTLSRRKFIALIGGGTVVAAAVPAGAFLATRTPNRALAPWDLAGSYADPRLNALSYALLAPNPHNLQPWKVELIGQDRLRLHRDLDKGLPATDPFDRQIVIGMGCFLEQLVIAASASGWSVAIDLYPEGEAGPIAEATFTEGATADPLAAQIMARRTCKEPFEDRALEASKANELELYADVYTDDATVAALRKLTVDAWTVEQTTTHTMQESLDLMRIGKAEIDANPDGIDFQNPMLEGLIATGIIGREAILDTESTGFQQAMEDYYRMLEDTRAYVAMTSPTNTREDQIAAGRRWLRLNLKTTEMGLSLQPVSQALQEYPEMAPHYTAAHTLLAEPGQTVQMLGRVGYGPDVPRSPRWPLDAKRLDV